MDTASPRHMLPPISSFARRPSPSPHRHMSSSAPQDARAEGRSHAEGQLSGTGLGRNGQDEPNRSTYTDESNRYADQRAPRSWQEAGPSEWQERHRMAHDERSRSLHDNRLYPEDVRWSQDTRDVYPHDRWQTERRSHQDGSQAMEENYRKRAGSYLSEDSSYERHVMYNSASQSYTPPDPRSYTPPDTRYSQPGNYSRRPSPPRAAGMTGTPPTTVNTSRRVAHLLSEQKRRESINTGFEDLRQAIPSCRDGQDSKATILRRALEYIHQLESVMEGNSNAYRAGDSRRLEAGSQRTGPSLMNNVPATSFTVKSERLGVV